MSQTNEINDQQHINKNYKELNSCQNIPIDSSQSIRIPLLGQCYDGDGGSCYRRQRYTRTHHVERLATEKYNKNGKGITFNDLLSSGMALHKEQAQTTLKHCLKRNALFTISAHKPQEYYPASLRAEIIKHKMLKNIPVGVTEVGCSCCNHYPYSSSTNPLLHIINHNYCNNNDSIIVQSLEGYVLPLLPSAPLLIHKMHFKLKISPECYKELQLPTGRGNNVKEHIEVIGKVRVSYLFYPNGTVMVFTESSNNLFKIEDETDRSRLMAFFGQVRDRLVTFLMDTHERIVPDILEWELTQCDINKDIKVSEALQYTGIKIQVKDFDHLFRVYVKSIGKDTICRVEESLSPKKPAVRALSEIFRTNSNEHTQQQPPSSSSISSCSDEESDRRKIAEIHDIVKNLFDLHKSSSAITTIEPEQESGKENERE
ncbi:MAG TPA: hypothetical protein VFI70_03165, partial [Nitrososphaeraceae archaeon]|nr:hypothetical protein [Nitrososphaeraceae archaeon]